MRRTSRKRCAAKTVTQTTRTEPPSTRSTFISKMPHAQADVGATPEQRAQPLKKETGLASWLVKDAIWDQGCTRSYKSNALMMRDGPVWGLPHCDLCLRSGTVPGSWLWGGPSCATPQPSETPWLARCCSAPFCQSFPSLGQYIKESYFNPFRFPCWPTSRSSLCTLCIMQFGSISVHLPMDLCFNFPFTNSLHSHGCKWQCKQSARWEKKLLGNYLQI